jgi:tetratricopeptide (TPR) repeat protein
MRALSLIGQALVKKGWLSMAVETFEKALESEATEEFTMELRYFLGDVLEQMGQFDRALEQFSTVAQIDYNYRDVRQRIERIRGQPGKPPAEGAK